MSFFDSTAELKQVINSLRRLRELSWNELYRHPGLRWEAIEHLKAPNGARVYSPRLGQQTRALGFRDGGILRLTSLHPDHDSAYRRWAGIPGKYTGIEA